MTEVCTDLDGNPNRHVNCGPVTSYQLTNFCGNRIARGGLITIERRKKGVPETQRTSTDTVSVTYIVYVPVIKM